ncbi:hypothetical protein [Streptosporangium saharense]|uniref:hypothetical protein n=1 Tax=Streptosporangium saharense TaxID=1706840 RepID=UPI0034494999
MGVSGAAGRAGLLALWLSSFLAARFRHGSPVLVVPLFVCVAVSAVYCLFWLYARWRSGGFFNRREEKPAEEEAADSQKSLLDSWVFQIVLVIYLFNTLNGYRDDPWVFLTYAPFPLMFAFFLLQRLYAVLRNR